ncbi:hypothetical protein bcgnr5388_28760 [Bacillus cereus]
MMLGIIISKRVSACALTTDTESHVIAAEIIRHSTNKHFTKNVLSFRKNVFCIIYKNSLSNFMVF